ncbi:MAG: hypothetical protein KDJ24_19720 [Gammaproteobacteria bacterium]|nr:hypothetical protein [Gammaproteobacteria bacterium]
MAVMNRSSHSLDLQEGLNTHFGMGYRQHMIEWDKVFDTEDSRKAFEEDVLETGFGAAQIKAEGSNIAYDRGMQGWTARYEHETIALAFAITEEAIEDNLYQRMGPKYAKALARALQHTKEIKGASILNHAFDTNYAGGDGKPLIAADHPLLGGGVGSNILGTPADIDEASIEQLLIQIRKCVDDRNVPIALRAMKLVVAPEDEYDSIRLTRSTMRVGTANNDISAIVAKGVFNEDPITITRLTDPDAWFIKTDAPDGLKHMRRVRVKRGVQGDFESGNMRYKARERYSFGWTDWRSIFGSQGA